MEQNDISDEKNMSYYERDLCDICHERDKDYTESRYSATCNECRRKYQKIHIPLKIILFLIAMLMLFIFSIIKFPPVLSDYKVYMNAEKNMYNKEFSLAYQKYYKLIEKYDGSLNLVFKASDAAMSAQYFEELAQLVSTYMIDKDLDDNQYTKGMEYYNLLDLYYRTLDEITKIEDQLPSDNIEENREKFINSLEQLLKDDNMDKTLIYLYLGGISSNNADSLKYLKLSMENDSRFTYPYAYYGNLLRYAGKIDDAKHVYELALKINATDAFAIRGLSIIDLLEGNKKISLEAIRYANELEPYGLYNAEALIIAMCENDLKDEAMSVLEDITEDGFETPEDLQEYLDGNINVRDYYVSKE